MGESDWTSLEEAAEISLQRRRHYVRHLAGLGWSKRAIARKTGEHRRTVIRWLSGIVTPPCAGKAHAKRPVRRMEKEVVTPRREKDGFFLCFSDTGEPDVGCRDDPVDSIEPIEPEQIPDVKRNLILAAALRYLMRMEDRSMEAVAEEIGCTRAAVSRSLGILSDRLGFKALNQKSDSARESYRRARLARSNGNQSLP